MEEVLFGGIIGVVFEDEVDGKPPMLVESDFTKISYLFLHCRDGSTYKLDPIDLQHKMDMAHFVPFDVSRLEAIPAPQPIRDRTCAMLNADHLPAPRDQRHPTMFPYAFNDRAAFEIGCGIQRAPPGHGNKCGIHSMTRQC
ncbi:hypothetical protein A0H81_09197 [Grifola frondosa]|uniref:Uncharacterized protein n=1 Tax=Grifola frondosa TaxID=5627 RepID=A0A1C7M6F8_GRIFR|nr:hypothetical protein A0H81_09197 [Grifola frondosa]